MTKEELQVWRRRRLCDEDPPGEDDVNEEDQLDEEIRILQKRKQIADLRRELAANDAMVMKQPDFQDIKHAIPKFSGSDLYDANKWMTDFERVCNAVNGDDFFRLKCIRRMMETGTEAEWFLRINKSTTYKEFRLIC